jgi:predicted Zn-dependent protease
MWSLGLGSWARPILKAVAMLASGAILAGQAPAPEPVTDAETELGMAVYDELKSNVEIIKASPLYDILGPVTQAIARVAQPQYEHPFKFLLVHEAKPNAFSAPGGNVYVTDSLLYFVRNTEELAGTLCHEVSHTIHHDSMKRIEDARRTKLAQIGAAVLLGPTVARVLAIALLGDLHSSSYSREAESAADVTGSDVCAAAGYNPWGLVWLFQDFQNAETSHVPQFLSDHPGNEARVKTLETHFQQNRSVFSKFNADRRSATPLHVPEDASVQFLRP